MPINISSCLLGTPEVCNKVLNSSGFNSSLFELSKSIPISLVTLLETKLTRVIKGLKILDKGFSKYEDGNAILSG